MPDEPMRPLVTVVIPVYGVERYVAQCLSSVVCQTYTNLDVVLVDDGSTDGCGAMCDECASRDARVRAVHTENRDLSAARNLGLSLAMGEYVLFLDGDDWLEPDAVDTLVCVAQRTGADMVCGRRLVEWKGRTDGPCVGVEEERILSGVEAIRAQLVDGLTGTAAWGRLCRASLFCNIRFPEGRLFEDVNTTWRLFTAADYVALIPDVVVHYRMREGSIVHSRSAEVLVDRWRAFKLRHDGLAGYSEDVRETCVSGCLSAILSVWIWWASCPRSDRERYGRQIEEMQSFARCHVREMLGGRYQVWSKVACLLGCWTSPVVWVPLYAANRVRRLFRRGGRLYE